MLRNSARSYSSWLNIIKAITLKLYHSSSRTRRAEWNLMRKFPWNKLKLSTDDATNDGNVFLTFRLNKAQSSTATRREFPLKIISWSFQWKVLTLERSFGHSFGESKYFFRLYILFTECRFAIEMKTSSIFSEDNRKPSSERACVCCIMNVKLISQTVYEIENKQNLMPGESINPAASKEPIWRVE